MLSPDAANLSANGSTRTPLAQQEGDENAVALRSAYVAIALGCVSSLICLLTLVAILHTRRPMAANLQFVFSLLCSDLLTSTSVISKLLYEVRRSNEPSPCATIFMDGLRMTAHIAAFFNLCLIAVDMHVAILNPLRYSTVINSLRVKLLISVSWSLAFLLGFSALYVPSTRYSPSMTDEAVLPQLNTTGHQTDAPSLSSSPYSPLDEAYVRRAAHNLTDYVPMYGPMYRQPSEFEDFCIYVFNKEYDSLFATLAILILSAVVMISIYVRIFCTIKRIHKTDDEVAKNYGAKAPAQKKAKWSARLFARSNSEQQCSKATMGSASSEASRTRRGLVTTMIILAVFCVCFLPYFLADAASSIIFFYFRTFLKESLYDYQGLAAEYIRVIQHYTFFLYDILMLNSILDPVIYALRMREVRVGYRKLFRVGNRFARRSVTGLSSRFGTCEGAAFDMSSGGAAGAVRRGVTVPDLSTRNGRSPPSFISQQDMSYDRLVQHAAGTHERIDVHADQEAAVSRDRDRLSIMSTSLNSNKTSSSLFENSDAKSTRPTSRNSE